MSPILATFDHAHGVLVYSVFICYLALQIPVCEQSMDAMHIILCELGASIRGALSMRKPTLARAVSRVVPSVAKPQMVRIHATANIAFVKDAHSFWYEADMPFVVHPVCPRSLGPNENDSVPAVVDCPLPKPASISINRVIDAVPSPLILMPHGGIVL